MFGRFKSHLKPFIILVVLSILLLSSIPAVHAASQPLVVVEVFKQDKVQLDLGEVTHVTRTLTIENDINYSIVPGMITLSLQKQSPDTLGPIPIPFTNIIRPLNVTNVTAMMADGTPLTDVNVSVVNDSTVIQYGVWVPIDPGQNITVILEYDSPDIVDSGLLFNNVEYPFTSSSIPVEDAMVEANVNGGHVTYASEKPTMNGSTYVWEQPQLGMDSWSVSFEYSALPLPLMPVSGSMLLWGLIILICLIWVAWTYTRPRKGQNKPR
jgi:hypothetical protein